MQTIKQSLYFFTFNNYYNRQVKKYDTLAEYGTPLYTLPATNFNPNDGVDTTHDVISGAIPLADYMIVVNEGNVIDSRWFLLETKRLSAQKFRLTLRRDVLADNWESIKNAPSFIEKGYVKDDNPLIFNNEQMGYNQIKTQEIMLENNLKTPWIVCYLSRYHTDEETKAHAYNEYTGKFKDEGELVADYILDSLDDYEYKYWTTHSYRWTSRIDFASYYNQLNVLPGYYRWRITSLGQGRTDYQNSTSSVANLLTYDGRPSTSRGKAQWKAMYDEYIKNASTTENDLPINTLTGLGTVEGYNLLQAENGKIIKVGSKFYRIATTGNNTYNSKVNVLVNKTSTLGNIVRKNLLTDNGFTINDDTVYRMEIQWSYNCPTTKIVIEEINNIEIDYDIKYTGSVTRDSAYEIIATPLKDTMFVTDKEGSQFRHNGDIGYQWFQDIVNRYNGAGWAYDIQIVPYINIDDNDISSQKVAYCTSGLARMAVAIKLTAASFNYSKEVEVPLRSSVKIGNEVDMFRFCSPNGVGSYDFNPYKNGGLNSYEADVTLIPFNPYIKIHPAFGGLYGYLPDDDFRGLICGGDFSLPILNDKWSTYELNNKYYQQQFNRNIESQNYNNGWALAEDIAGIVTGAASGAAAGSMGGPVGAVAGGIAGAAGGIVDTIAGQSKYKQEIQRQKDQFGYQLGTIKAQANTLTRTTSYNISNKYFPYIEYYTASQEEVQALENKLKYNGMTINVIGKITDYLGPGETYIQCKPIRLSEISDDYHMASSIAQELQQGAFVT